MNKFRATETNLREIMKETEEIKIRLTCRFCI